MSICKKILGGLIALGAMAPPTVAQQGKPNIVYILADDMGYGDVSIYNPDSRISTPHIDGLAREGMRFTDAHAPTSVCTPTRYAIMTGTYAWRSRLPVGVLRGYGRTLIPQGSFTVGSLLQQQGYHTAVIGKWHLGLDWAVKESHRGVLNPSNPQMNEFGMLRDMDPEHIDFTQPPKGGPLSLGFDYSFILPASLDMEPYCYLERDTLIELPTAHTPGNDLNTGYTGAFWRAGKMAPSFEFDRVLPTFTDKAVQYIEQQAKQPQPFFLYLPLPAPHTPWLPADDQRGASSAGDYGDFVQMVDDAVGRVLRAIDSLGIGQNTLVIFTSDNGPYWRPQFAERFDHHATGPYRGMKGDAFEGGHRIPFIVRWPAAVKQGTASDALTTLANLPATCAAILKTGIPTDAAPDSYSILPVLKGETAVIPGQRAVIHQASNGYLAIRQGPWKLIDGLGSGGFSEPQSEEAVSGGPAGQLYNLEKDPQETTNRYQQFPDKVKELRALLEEIKKMQKTH
ncbi:arylsulfatase [Parapedobacter sp. 2B3]|uniref:sulfatase family protein n=1 Tax=Parapedobacter sp. 2B3 TaxID=3342381 RepID=UPI0035B69CD1